MLALSLLRRSVAKLAEYVIPLDLSTARTAEGGWGVVPRRGTFAIEKGRKVYKRVEIGPYGPPLPTRSSTTWPHDHFTLPKKKEANKKRCCLEPLDCPLMVPELNDGASGEGVGGNRRKSQKS